MRAGEGVSANGMQNFGSRRPLPSPPERPQPASLLGGQGGASWPVGRPRPRNPQARDIVESSTQVAPKGRTDGQRASGHRCSAVHQQLGLRQPSGAARRRGTGGGHRRPVTFRHRPRRGRECASLGPLGLGPRGYGQHRAGRGWHTWHNSLSAFTSTLGASGGVTLFDSTDSAGALRYFLPPTVDEAAVAAAHRGNPCQQLPSACCSLTSWRLQQQPPEYIQRLEWHHGCMELPTQERV